MFVFVCVYMSCALSHLSNCNYKWVPGVDWGNKCQLYVYTALMYTVLVLEDLPIEIVHVKLILQKIIEKRKVNYFSREISGYLDDKCWYEEWKCVLEGQVVLQRCQISKSLRIFGNFISIWFLRNRFNRNIYYSTMSF